MNPLFQRSRPRRGEQRVKTGRLILQREHDEFVPRKSNQSQNRAPFRSRSIFAESERINEAVFFTPGGTKSNWDDFTEEYIPGRPAGRPAKDNRTEPGRQKQEDPLRLVEESRAAPNQIPNSNREQGGEEMGRETDRWW